MRYFIPYPRTRRRGKSLSNGGDTLKTVRFTKMHGVGNDYVYIDCMKETPADPAYLARIMSPRRFSVGSDGVVLICPSDSCDAKMRMFNADGSEGKMCGNAIRCVGKFLYERGYTSKTELTVETLSGDRRLTLDVRDGKVVSVSVGMGRAILAPSEIPVLFRGDAMIDEPVTVDGAEYRITAVSMGNPHAVTFVPDVGSVEIDKIGPQFEYLPIFPDRVNTEFVRVLSRDRIEMRVWERGSGETLACGTGACASVVASVLNGRCDAGVPVTVGLLGGELVITCSAGLEVTMTGPAEFVFDGEFFLDN